MALAVVALACGSGDQQAGGDADGGTGSLSGYTREPVPSVQDVDLQLAADGSSFSPAATSPDGLRIVYFGYTSCPDVCPTTMSDLKRAIAQLDPADQQRIEVAMVTIDPDRDVPEKLDAYVTTFIPDGDAVRFEDPEALAAAAAAFGAQYRVEPGDGDEPEVSHSGDLYVVDARGDLVLQWPFGVSREDIAADLRTLLETAANGHDTTQEST